MPAQPMQTPLVPHSPRSAKAVTNQHADIGAHCVATSDFSFARWRQDLLVALKRVAVVANVGLISPALAMTRVPSL